MLYPAGGYAGEYFPPSIAIAPPEVVLDFAVHVQRTDEFAVHSQRVEDFAVHGQRVDEFVVHGQREVEAVSLVSRTWVGDVAAQREVTMTVAVEEVVVEAEVQA
jgi:hypothetical protein